MQAVPDKSANKKAATRKAAAFNIRGEHINYLMSINSMPNRLARVAIWSIVRFIERTVW